MKASTALPVILAAVAHHVALTSASWLPGSVNWARALCVCTAVVLALACASLARAKGRSRAWGLLGLVLWGVGAVVVVFLPRRDVGA